MRSLARVVASLAISLWLGGLIVLFMAVTSLFATFDRHTAGTGATGIFQRFEVYQLVLAVLAIAGVCVGLPRSGRRTVMAVLLVLSTISAAAITFLISPRIDALRIAGQTDTSQFKALHGVAMSVYLLVTILVAVTAILGALPQTAATRSADRTSQDAPADRAATRR